MELKNLSMDQDQEKEFLLPEKVSFNEEKNTLLLEVNREQVDLSGLQSLAEKNNFDPKDSFHITVLSFKNAAEIKKTLGMLPEAERQKRFTEIKSLIDTNNWNFTLEPRRYHISKEYVSPDPQNKGTKLKERRESYIQMVNLPGMEIFYNKLNEILGVNLEIPPAHITLYTGGDDREKAKIGIGIKSQDEFLKLNPESLEKSINQRF